MIGTITIRKVARRKSWTTFRDAKGRPKLGKQTGTGSKAFEFTRRARVSLLMVWTLVITSIITKP